MNAPVNKSNIRWMDAVVLVFAVSIGAAVLSGSHKTKAPVVASVPQPEPVIALSLIVNTPPAPPPGLTVHYSPKLTTITPRVKVALLMDETLYPSANPALNCINVDTDSDDKTIVLKGTVQTEAMKKRAEAITRKASQEASYKIDNQLTILKR